ncbi:MAG: flagellar basal body-associated FliL family protein [Pirellulales bacterium]|nr:flagellar basal body-associated FliL family protein [Pirellulales bacterium]
MSKQTTPTPAAATKEHAAEGKGAPALMNKITILALILAVVLGECLAAFFFLGNGEPAAAADAKEAVAEEGHDKKHDQEHDKGHAKSHDKGHGGHGAAEKHDKGHGHGEEKKAEHGHAAPVEHFGENREVDLGEYSIMATDPASGASLLVDFHIFGTVTFDESGEFDALFEENRHRMRHQVITIVRSAEMADLTDASLGLIRRQILEKTNQLLGKPLVQEVIFSKFSFIEQ